LISVAVSWVFPFHIIDAQNLPCFFSTNSGPISGKDRVEGEYLCSSRVVDYSLF
jgi:hypothetical protein